MEQLLAQGSSPIRRYPNPDSDREDHMGSTRDVYGTGDMGTRSIELGHGHGIGRGGVRYLHVFGHHLSHGSELQKEGLDLSEPRGRGGCCFIRS